MKWKEKLSRFFFPLAWAKHDLQQSLLASLGIDFDLAMKRDDFPAMTRAILGMERVSRI